MSCGKTLGSSGKVGLFVLSAIGDADGSSDGSPDGYIVGLLLGCVFVGL